MYSTFDSPVHSALYYAIITTVRMPEAGTMASFGSTKPIILKWNLNYVNMRNCYLLLHVRIYLRTYLYSYLHNVQPIKYVYTYKTQIFVIHIMFLQKISTFIIAVCYIMLPCRYKSKLAHRIKPPTKCLSGSVQW